MKTESMLKPSLTHSILSGHCVAKVRNRPLSIQLGFTLRTNITSISNNVRPRRLAGIGWPKFGLLKLTVKTPESSALPPKNKKKISLLEVENPSNQVHLPLVPLLFVPFLASQSRRSREQAARRPRALLPSGEDRSALNLWILGRVDELPPSGENRSALDLQNLGRVDELPPSGEDRSAIKVTTRSPIYSPMFGGRTGAALVDGHPTLRLLARPFGKRHVGIGATAKGGPPLN